MEKPLSYRHVPSKGLLIFLVSASWAANAGLLAGYIFAFITDQLTLMYALALCMLVFITITFVAYRSYKHWYVYVQPGGRVIGKFQKKKLFKKHNYIVVKGTNLVGAFHIERIRTDSATYGSIDLSRKTIYHCPKR